MLLQLSSVSSPAKLVLWDAAVADAEAVPPGGVGGMGGGVRICTQTQSRTAKQNLGTLGSSESLQDDGGRATGR